jgi:hypothetical protein
MAKTPSPPPPPSYPEQPPEGERPRRRGREHEVHDEINKRRLGGGAEPDAEAFQRALEQWQQLPGSIVRPPSDVKAPAPSPPPPAEGGDDKPPPGRGENKP